MSTVPVSDINTLGDRILKCLGVSRQDVYGTNEDGTENKNDLYLRRYYIYRGKHRPHIYLHHIVRSDYERACHDHPWDFVSLILKGGYREFNEVILPHTTFAVVQNGVVNTTITIGGRSYRTVPGGTSVTTSRVLRPGDVVRHGCEDLHRLELTKPAWTLVFTGPRKRDWGFQTPDKGWIKWNTLYQYIKDMME